MINRLTQESLAKLTFIIVPSTGLDVILRVYNRGGVILASFFLKVCTSVHLHCTILT